MRVFPAAQDEFVTCKLEVADVMFDCHHLIAFPMVHSGEDFERQLANWWGMGKLDIGKI